MKIMQTFNVIGRSTNYWLIDRSLVKINVNCWNDCDGKSKIALKLQGS